VRQADLPPATASGSAPVPGPGRTIEVDKADAPADAQPETEAADTPEASTPESPTPAGPQRSGGSAEADAPAPREQSARVGAD
jgi:hypothetical protein